MRIRSAFLVAALALLATVTLERSSQAGPVEIVVTDSILVQKSAFSSSTITAVTLTFNGLLGSPLISNAEGGLGVNSSGVVTPLDTVSGNQITLTFASPVSVVTGAVTFETEVPSKDVGMLSALITGSGTVSTIPGTLSVGSMGPVTTALSFSAVSAVPEPTSMALLGIGMTSFLAFRRFFKRNLPA